MTSTNQSAFSKSWQWVISFFKRFDFLQIIPMFVLLAVGVLFIYGIGQQIGGDTAQTFWKKQIVWIIIGLIVWLIITFCNYRMLAPGAPFIYALSIILLILVFFYGVRIYGARRWLSFGGIRFQPSELAKLAVLTTVSWILSIKYFDVNKFLTWLVIGLVTAIPLILILKEPDLGSALVLLPIVGVIIFIAQLKWRYIAIAFVLCLIAVSCTYPFLKDYQKGRILVFLDPERDPGNRGWNGLQSELAVGSGGRYGKGFMQGTQHTLGFLPKTVSNTDFIFSVIAEETGFLGSTTIITMYILLIIAALRTALLASDPFGQYLAVGITGILFTHTFINIAMTMRMMPITGLPLPFISYGGSFLVSTMVYMGILQSIYSRRKSMTGEN